MKCNWLSLTAVAVLTFGQGQTAWAVPALLDFGINIDGTTTCSDSSGQCDTGSAADLSGVAGVNDAGFNFTTGLGSIFVTMGGAGAHSVDLFLDHDIGALFNDEVGSTNGAPAAGQSWEIDEPGFGSFGNGSGGVQYLGDIFANFLASVFDNQAFFDAIDNQTLTPPDYVSMGLASTSSWLLERPHSRRSPWLHRAPGGSTCSRPTRARLFGSPRH